MKILFLTEHFVPETNAAASRIFERACYWVKWGHDVTVLTSAPNFPQGRVYAGYKNRLRQVEIIDGIRVVRVKTFISPNEGFYLRILDFLSFMFSSVVAGLFEKKPDIVVASSPQLFAGLGGWALGRFFRVPFVLEIADLTSDSIKGVGVMNDNLLIRMVTGLELFLYKSSSAIIALTPAFKRNLNSKGVDPDKIAVIMNGVDLWRFKRFPKEPKLINKYKLEGVFVIGYIGTFGVAQGLLNMLETAEMLRKNKEVKMILVGQGAEKKKLEDRVVSGNVTNVTIIPNQPKSEIGRYWALCDLAVVHLKNSSVFSKVIPSKIFEAMAMGLPIILVAPKGEASKIIEKTKSGIIVSAGNPREFFDAVIKLKDDQVLCETLKRNSSNSANLFSRERQAGDMLNVLDSVVKNEKLTVTVSPDMW